MFVLRLLTPSNQFWNQLLATVTVNIISVAHGCAIGWLSPVLLTLQSDESPLSSGPLTIHEASWIGAIFCFGGITGNLSFGLIANKFGRKKALCILAMPQLAFWLILITTDDVSYLYAARIFAGMAGGGAFVSIPLFISDIADKELHLHIVGVRGGLGSVLLFAVNIGILGGFITGDNLSYKLVPCILILLPVTYLLLICWFPETPQFLYKQNDIDGARKSLEFYKNIRTDTDGNKSKLELAFQELRALIDTESNEANDLSISFRLLFEKEGAKAMLLGLGLVSFNILSGCFATVMYAAHIFKESGSKLDPNTSAIIVAIAQLFGTLISTQIVNRFDRKLLMALSTFSTALGLFLMGGFSFFYKYQNFNLLSLSWIPVASTSFALFSASVALLPLTFVVLAEIFPQKIRPVGSSICNGILNILAFTQLKALPILVETIGVYGIMWIGAGISTIGVLFFIFIVPETKMKSI